MAESCGDKDLMRAIGGQTIDEPCQGWTGMQFYCNPPDVEDWKMRVVDLMEMMVATWNALYDAEGEQPERIHTAEGSDLRTRWGRVEARIAGVPEVPWYGVGDQAARAVGKYASIVQDQACLLEIMRKQIKAVGKEPPKLPYHKPSPRFDLGEALRKTTEQTPKIVTGLLVVGGIAALAYVLRPVIAQIILRRKGVAAPRPLTGRVKR
jgi:hypothetical protein